MEFKFDNSEKLLFEYFDELFEPVSASETERAGRKFSDAAPL